MVFSYAWIKLTISKLIMHFLFYFGHYWTIRLLQTSFSTGPILTRLLFSLQLFLRCFYLSFQVRFCLGLRLYRQYLKGIVFHDPFFVIKPSEVDNFGTFLFINFLSVIITWDSESICSISFLFEILSSIHYGRHQ